MLHGPDGEVETVVDDQAVRLGRRREGRKHLGRGTRLSGRSSVRASWRDVTRKFRVRHAVLERPTLDEAVLEEVRGMGREQLVHEYRRLCITGFRLTTGRGEKAEGRIGVTPTRVIMLETLAGIVRRRHRNALLAPEDTPDVRVDTIYNEARRALIRRLTPTPAAELSTRRRRFASESRAGSRRQGRGLLRSGRRSGSPQVSFPAKASASFPRRSNLSEGWRQTAAR